MSHVESQRPVRAICRAASALPENTRYASRSNRLRRLVRIATIALALLAGTRDAHAQFRSVVLDTYRSAVASSDGFGINRPETPGHLVMGGQVNVDYANDPLVIERNTTETGAVVSDQVNVQATAFIGLYESGMVFLQVPFNVLMSGESSAQQTFGGGTDSVGPGDLSIGGRWRLLGDRGKRDGLALQAAVQVPSATWLNGEQRFSGTRGVGFWPQALGEYDIGRHVHLLGNVGVLVDTKGASLEDEALTADVTYRAGVNVPLSHDFADAYVELLGSTDFATVQRSPLELLLGAKIYPRSWMLGLAAGPGLQNGLGSPDLRVVGALGYLGQPSATPIAPEPSPACAGQQEDMDGFQDDDGCPDPDNDKDGLLDAKDKCPLEAEDVDGFEDDDGCPDLDNDKDGVPDAKDRCPQQAEDVDGFEDDDGCPDPDNDKDGAPDAKDKCPLEAEDVDGFQDDDGCPDPDNDKDGVLDAADGCPTDAETVNGVDDADGCPDRVRVDRESKQLTTLEPVFFKSMSAEILERSFAMLTEIAGLIVAHPELGTISVEGHTDVRGRRSFNLTLSQARADSVRSFLIEHGVPPERVQAKGFGSQHPLKLGNDEATNEINRRVEFRLAP